MITGIKMQGSTGRTRKTSGRRTRPAFTLVEVVVASAIVSVLLVAALTTAVSARVSYYKLAERNRALQLAQTLMAEILQQAYADPAAGPTSFGVGADETATDRSTFDDVDDYGGWVACPPTNRDGSVIPNAADYEQRVTVNWVSPTDLTVIAVANTGVKRIQVTINRQGRKVITLTAYRTQGWVNPVEAQGAGL